MAGIILALFVTAIIVIIALWNWYQQARRS
jgi:hypothetical protein